MTKREELARVACFAESQRVRGLCGCAGPDECVSYEADGQYFAMVDAILDALMEPGEGALDSVIEDCGEENSWTKAAREGTLVMYRAILTHIKESRDD